MKSLRLAVLCWLCTKWLEAATTDGPYVILHGDGNMSAWTAEAEADATYSKRTRPIKVGEEVTLGPVDGRVSFTVRIRSPEAVTPDPDYLEPSGGPVFLLADTHGEFLVATELLLKQRIINDQLSWSFGRGRLIVLGDVFDRGSYQTELVWLLYKLEAEAREAGGQVIYLLGNHETMILTGNLSYLNYKYSEVAAALWVANYSELWGVDTLLGQWLRSKATILKLGDTLCLHGGLSIAAADRKLGISEINQMVRDWLNSKTSKDSGRLSWITGTNGPLWYRGLVQNDAKPDDVEIVKKFYGVDRIAVGHTIVPTVTPLYNGSVIAVQVYPTKDKASGKMNMEGVYIDEQGTWHKAKIDGSREILRDDAGNPIKNGLPTPATGAAGTPNPNSLNDQSEPKAEEKPAEQKKAA